MSSNVSPQTVFITGANRGIGLAIVKELVQLKEPPKIIFATYRNADGATELLQLAENNKSVRPIQLDVRDHSKYAETIEHVSSIVGGRGLNLLINNAAIQPPAGFETITREDLVETFEVNTVVPTLLTRAFLPLLKKGYESGNGITFTWSKAAVINIASMLGSISNAANVARQDAYAYKISKAGLNMVTKLLSLDLKQHNILVVGVHPGWVQTEMGGSDATFTVEDGGANILATFKMLTSEHSGGYISSVSKQPINY